MMDECRKRDESLNKKSILIVEDEAIFAMDLKATLEEMGYFVSDIFPRGEQAIDHCKKELPDLILMDIRLAGRLNGVETAKEIHKDNSVPILFQTAHADMETLEQAKMAEPYGYLVKPVKTDNLASTLDMTFYRAEIDKKKKKVEQDLLALKSQLEGRVAEEVKKRMIGQRLLVQQAKMAAMGELLGIIAHQWKQPLAALSFVIGGFKRMSDKKELDFEKMEKLASQGKSLLGDLNTTLNDFRGFFRPEKNTTEFDIKVAIFESATLLSDSLKQNNIQLTLHCKRHQTTYLRKPDIKCCNQPTWKGVKNEFEQVIFNILSNARDAICERQRAGVIKSGCIEVEVDHLSEEIAHQIEIKIRDNGGGIPVEHLDKIFEPHFTTKADGHGSGIGLYLVKLVMENFGGKIFIHNVGPGAEFVIRL